MTDPVPHRNILHRQPATTPPAPPVIPSQQKWTTPVSIPAPAPKPKRALTNIAPSVFTWIFIGAVFLAVAGMVLFLYATDRDPALFLATLPLIIAAVGNLLKLGKVDKQTNGANAELRAQLEAARIENVTLRSILPPGHAQSVPIITTATPTTPEQE